MGKEERRRRQYGEPEPKSVPVASEPVRSRDPPYIPQPEEPAESSIARTSRWGPGCI
jgi:hypothetical protein